MTRFLIFPRIQGLICHANCLLRKQFAWNVKTVYWGNKKIKYFKIHRLLKILPSMLRVSIIVKAPVHLPSTCILISAGVVTNGAHMDLPHLPKIYSETITLYHTITEPSPPTTAFKQGSYTRNDHTTQDPFETEHTCQKKWTNKEALEEIGDIISVLLRQLIILTLSCFCYCCHHMQ